MDAGLAWTIVGSVAGVAAVVSGGIFGVLQLREDRESRGSGSGAAGPSAKWRHSPTVNRLAGKAAQVVVGEIPREPPAFQLRPELSRGLAAKSGVTVVRALTGARGVGKTQLAAAFARARIADGWPVIGWITAEDGGQVLAGLERLGRALGLIAREDDPESAALKVRAWLETQANGKCLVVFDNAVDPEAIRRWLPACGDAKIVVTSTSTAFEDMGEGIDVDVFSEAEALAFLRERTGSDDLDGARAVAEELGYLPLALGQAAAVMRTQRLTYPMFLDRIRAFPTDQLLVPRPGDGYVRGAAQAVLVSLASAESSDAFARTLAGLISVLSPAGINRDILRKVGELSTVNAALADAAVGRLAEASLLAFTVSGDSVVMHRFTRRIAQERERRDNSLADSLMLACRALAEFKIPPGSRWSKRTLGMHVIQHIDSVWEIASHIHQPGAGQVPGYVRAALKLRSWAVEHLWALNDSARAISAGQEVLVDHETYLGDDCLETMSARAALALGYGGLGRHDEAIVLHRSILAWCDRKLGSRYRITLYHLMNLGNNYMESAEDYQEPVRLNTAVALHESCYPRARESLGEEAFFTLLSGDNLARSYRMAGRLREALEIGEQILGIRARVSGSDDIWIISSQVSLAETYWELGQPGKAFGMLDEALQQLASVAAQDDPMLLSLKMTKAKLTRQSGDPKTAAAMYRELASEYIRILGYSHGDIFRAQEGLALSYEQAGQLGEAISAYSDMETACLKMVGAGSPITRRAQIRLAELRAFHESARQGSPKAGAAPQMRQKKGN